MGAEPQRRAIRIRGVVQGVGFRPAMYRLADSLGLAGFVLNDAFGVWLEIEGSSTAIAEFVDGIARAAPPASRIDNIEAITTEPLGSRCEPGFRIAASAPTQATGAVAGIPVDLAPCSDCLRELVTPTNRRFGYPFINCTACGPRFTIVREVPYDRPKTTMAAFEMCAACRSEYENPLDRRFHAEPIACAACGPQVRLVVDGVATHAGPSAVHAAAAAIANGAIVAVKGAGGFALAVDATSRVAVALLRERKRRPHKPFAVMVRTLADAASIAHISTSARAWLVSPARPIVLVPMRDRTSLAPAVAPGLGDVGVYLPPTPLQYALLAEGPPLQVMTSGNFAEEPIARTNEEALSRLTTIADMVLLHDRDIHARADDSVVRATTRTPIPMRRSRGFVPDAFKLSVDGPSVLAVGGHERNTVCLSRGGQAVLSQHIGDLDHPEADRFFREAIDHLCELLGTAPAAVAHDLHPDYRSSRFALACGLPRIGVQHHHAHVAACLAEHGRTDRVLGVAFDGTGLGDDGALWGGEFLEADLASSRRRGHLRPIALAGGEAAIREPIRLALAALIDAGESLDVLDMDPSSRRRLRILLESDAGAVRATGAGRWFDAVAALVGVGRNISYDGQAAAQLEALAASSVPTAPRPFELGLAERADTPFEIDLRPAIREITRELHRGTAASRIAIRFHDTLAAGIGIGCRHARDRGGPRVVVLTGGCFQNRILLERTTAVLETDGFEVLVHRRVPPNDGGIALGQIAVASVRLASRATATPSGAESSSTHVSRNPR